MITHIIYLQDGSSSLLFASKKGHSAVVAKLLSYGANTELCGEEVTLATIVKKGVSVTLQNLDELDIHGWVQHHKFEVFLFAFSSFVLSFLLHIS